MLRNNIFPNSETKIKKSVLGEARALSGSFGIFEIVRVVFSQSCCGEMKKSRFLSLETISKMLRNNHFPNSETKIKKSISGEARVLSGSFGIFEIVRVVFSQSTHAEMKISRFLSLKRISKMLRNNSFPISETKIKKSIFGEARALSESFGIFEIARVVFSQSPVPKKKFQRFF